MKYTLKILNRKNQEAKIPVHLFTTALNMVLRINYTPNMKLREFLYSF